MLNSVFSCFVLGRVFYSWVRSLQQAASPGGEGHYTGNRLLGEDTTEDAIMTSFEETAYK